MKTLTKSKIYGLEITDDDFTFLDDLSDDADDYEVERTESDEDDGCEGGACKI